LPYADQAEDDAESASREQGLAEAGYLQKGWRNVATNGFCSVMKEP
jgi:hypothetical protein